MAAVEAIAPEAAAAAAEGTLVAEAAGGAESLALRGGAGAMSSSMAGDAAGMAARGAPVSRLLVSDPLLQFAEQRGVLQQALYRLTAGGTRTAVLGIDGNGVIRAGLEPIAQFRGTRLFYQDEAVGELRGNLLYDLRDGAAQSPVAELDGVIPGRLLAARGASVSLASRDFLVDVIEVQEGSYLVRLSDSTTMWVPAELVALALLGTADGTCSDAPGSLVRHSGATVAFRSCRSEGGVYRLETAEGLVLVDAAEFRRIIPGSLAANAVAPALNLTGGYSVFGAAQRSGDVIRVTLPSGDIVIVDPQRLVSSGEATDRETSRARDVRGSPRSGKVGIL
jgi:hypothetical protein